MMGFFDFSEFFASPKTPRQLIITDVTRMAGDAVCIAAAYGDKAVRLSTPQPRDGWLTSVGNLTPGDRIALTWRREKRYTPPHIEDGRWVPASLRKLGRLSPADLVAAVERHAFSSVVKAFSQPLFRSPRGNPAFRPGKGSRSLATLRVKRVLVRPAVRGVRADFVDAEGIWKMVPVEDLAIRTHEEMCRDCRGDGFAENLANEFSRGESLIRIGLGRAFQSDGESRPGCYLQVNHILPIDAIAHPHFAPIG